VFINRKNIFYKELLAFNLILLYIKMLFLKKK